MRSSIAFVGFMGSGKSALAEIISAHNNIPFIETDSEIEKMTGKSITQIFEDDGEDQFRLLESEMIKKLAKKKEPLIISTGGGLPCHNGNMDFLTSNFITIYLQVTMPNLLQRLQYKKENRPMIAHLDNSELEEFIQSKLIEREPFYNQAKIIVNLDNRDKYENAVYLEKILRRNDLLK